MEEEQIHELEKALAIKEQEALVLRQKLAALKKDVFSTSEQSPLLFEWINFLDESVQICDKEGNLIFVNDITAEKTGYAKHELLGMNVQDLEVDFKGKHNWNKRLDILKAKKSIITEIITLRKDGSTFPVEVHSRYAEIKGIEYVIIISHDITEKKAKENQLIRNKFILKEILKNTSEGFFFVDVLTNVIIDCNDRALDLFNYESKSELVGQQWSLLFKNPLQDQEFQKIKTELYESGSWSSEFIFQTKEAHPFWGALFVTIIKLQNESSYFLIQIADIDEKKSAEENLRKSEKRYRDLVEHNQALICTHGMDGEILSVNPASCKSLDYDENELIGNNLSLLFDPKNISGYKAYLKQIKEHGRASGIMQVKSKTKKKMYWLYHNYRVDEGPVSYVVGSAQDITERILAQKELKKAKNIAEQSLRARELFLANISHEIRTPLHGILGISSLLGKTQINPEQSNLLKIIRASAENLMVIINDILDVAKMESGKLQLESIPFDLAETLHNILEPMRIKAQTKGLEFHAHLPNSPLLLLGDPYRLSQIINNLLNNAIKFTHHGHVKTTVEIFSQSESEILLDISIEDTGIGIHTDKILDIFSEFVQTDSSHTRIYGGTGLGLSICKKLVELQNGKIYVQSVLGKGSTFGFIIPFSIPLKEEKYKEQELEYDLSPLSNTRILIVEDNIINQLIAKNVLEHKSATVDVASNGEQALELVERNDYDVILMDIQMPDMDGEKVAAIIRTMPHPRKANIPIIAITANAMKGDNNRYLKAGMDNYLTKPYTQEELYKKIAYTLHFPQKNTTPKTPTNSNFPTIGILNKMKELVREESSFPKSFVDTFLQSAPQEIELLKESLTIGNMSEIQVLIQKFQSLLIHFRDSKLEESLRVAKEYASEGKLADLTAEIQVAIYIIENMLEELSKENMNS